MAGIAGTTGDKGLLLCHLAKSVPAALFQFKAIPFFTEAIRPFGEGGFDGLAFQLSLTSVALFASMAALGYAFLNETGEAFTRMRKIGAGLEAAGGLNLFLCGIRTALDEESARPGMEFGLGILMIVASGVIPFLFMGFTLIPYDREKGEALSFPGGPQDKRPHISI